jgi:hypothetical protein
MLDFDPQGINGKFAIRRSSVGQAISILGIVPSGGGGVPTAQLISREVSMLRLISLLLCGITCAVDAAPVVADNNGSMSPARFCAVKAKGLYGFQCQGTSFTGAAFEPVTFIGTVQGDASGFFEGYGTFNSSSGSMQTHVAGTATFGPNCFGHIDYTTSEIVLPGGGTIPIPPISFDFVGVDGGNEILGAQVAPAGVGGDLVPRLACRLVRI